MRNGIFYHDQEGKLIFPQIFCELNLSYFRLIVIQRLLSVTSNTFHAMFDFKLFIDEFSIESLSRFGSGGKLNFIAFLNE